MTFGRRILISAALLLFAATNAATAEPKRILLLYSFGPNFAPWNEYSKTLREELEQQSRERLDIYEASLASARFSDDKQQEALADYLRALFVKRAPDLIVSIGAPAAGFSQRYRQQLFPSAPMLLAAVERRRVRYEALTSNDAVVPITIDIASNLENILRVLPDTENLVIVIGNSPIEKYWIQQIDAAIKTVKNAPAITWFNELSFDDMQKRAAILPPRSAVFFTLLAVDAAGVPQEEGKALTALRAVANAPIFSYVDAYFGKGIVGGPLISVREATRQAAKVAMRILGGEAPGDIKTPPVGAGTTRFDWREMRRWGISEARLPAGSIVEFREPTVFEQYKGYIAAAVGLCLLQAVFIIVLLANRRRMRRAEVAAHELNARLITAQEDERARLARELHDDITQRLAVLAIEAGREERGSPALAGVTSKRALREDLVKLSEDVHALSYQLHPSILGDLGLVEALRSECEAFARRESIRVDVKAPENPAALPPGVALGLFRIAQEALRNVGRHARASTVEISVRRLDGGLQLAVRDDGAGFDPAKRNGRPSLGHASMRQRVRLLGGELDIDSAPGHGTTVLAWVPLKEVQGESRPRAFG